MSQTTSSLEEIQVAERLVPFTRDHNRVTRDQNRVTREKNRALTTPTQSPTSNRTMQTKTCRFALALSTILALAACDKTAQVTLNLVEPFDQKGQALKDVGTIRITYLPVDAATGEPGDGGDSVAFSTANPQTLQFPLDEGVLVNVEAFEGDVEQNQGVLGDKPQAIGRSVPLALGADPATELSLVTGLVDSFGCVTSRTEEGVTKCETLQSDSSIPGRHGHTATYLPTVGKVLIVGGAAWVDGGGAQADRPNCRSFTVAGTDTVRCFAPKKTAELFDPWTGTFTPLPDLDNARAHHTATLLPDGRVLVAGGFTFISEALEPLINGFIFDPAKLGDDPSTSEPYGSPILFASQRAMHTATLLPTFERGSDVIQQVALVGGCDGTGCTPGGVYDSGGDPTLRLAALIEVLEIAQGGNDPTITTVTLDQEGKDALGRSLHAATVVNDDLLVITGGVNIAGPRANVEVFRIVSTGLTREILDAGTATLSVAVVGHTQVSVDPTTIALIGGTSDAPGGTIATAAVGASTVQFWSTSTGPVPGRTAELISWRIGAAATTLPSGDILVVGGRIPEGGATAERLELDPTEQYIARALTLPLTDARVSAGMTQLVGGQVLFTGGFDPVTGVTTAAAEIYFAE